MCSKVESVEANAGGTCTVKLMFRLDVCIIIYLLRNMECSSLSSIKTIDGTRRESENSCALR